MVKIFTQTFIETFGIHRIWFRIPGELDKTEQSIVTTVVCLQSFTIEFSPHENVWYKLCPQDQQRCQDFVERLTSKYK